MSNALVVAQFSYFHFKFRLFTQQMTLSQLGLRLARKVKLRPGVPLPTLPWALHHQFCFPSHLIISSCAVYHTPIEP